MLPDPIKKFADVFSKLPSIGPRQAIRLAYYISALGKEKIKEFSQNFENLNKLETCKNCFSIFYPHEEKQQLCNICSNPHRKKEIIAIVEKNTDLNSLEKTRKFHGRYLVMGNLQKPGVLDNEQKYRIETLKKFIATELLDPSTSTKLGKAEEIIIATNPTTYGDLSAALLTNELKDCAQKITRLGRGIPTGGEIEFADEETLENALERRI